MVELNVEVKEIVETYNDTEYHIKPYLTSAEIESIINQVVNSEGSYIDKKNIIDILIMRFCTDIKDFDTDEMNVETLDKYRGAGIIFTVKSYLPFENLETIKEGINDITGLNSTITNLIEGFIDSVQENIKNVDLTETLKQLSVLKSTPTELQSQ